MSLLQELKGILTDLGIPAETGKFSDKAPDRYAVLTPLIDNFDLYADNKPLQDIEEVRVSVFDKGNYKSIKKMLENRLIAADLTITDRRYVGYEADTTYHHIAIDVAKNYEY